MDIERLSKSQLLLLTLLVSFVTSIATGIVTISLLEEAPETVTQTVNRVVERTIERVAPEGNASTGQGAAVVTRETTVVVSEEEVLPETVATHSRRTIAVYEGATTTPPIASGLYLPKHGLIATAVAGLTTENTYLISFSNGEVYESDVVYEEDSRRVAFLKPNLAEGETLPGAAAYEFVPIERVKQGQSVLSLTARGAVEEGIVTLVENPTIETNITTGSVSYGATLVTTFGDLIGIRVAPTTGAGTDFISISHVLEVLALYEATQE